MFEDIQERMRALIAQHGNALVALAALHQHPEGQQNDEQTNSLENSLPHINVLVEFNQDMSKCACECLNRLLKEQCATQRTELAGPFKMPQERNNHLCREWQTVQQATTRAQPSLGNDALQLFGDEDALTPSQWDCG
jgi:hypothetical protein